MKSAEPDVAKVPGDEVPCKLFLLLSLRDARQKTLVISTTDRPGIRDFTEVAGERCLGTD
jgi:hypothetical protein